MSITISEQGLSNLAPALAKFQEEVKNPANSATNPQFRSKYAPLDVVINTVKPILAKNGLSFIQSTGAEGESIIITTMLIHESGEFIQSAPLVLPAYQTKGGGVKEFNAQGAGSAITYGRRYSLSAILGLSSEDDDDANGQSQGYKDASSNQKPAGGGQSEEEKEKRRQEALAKAEARKAQSQQETPPPSENPSTSLIDAKQEKVVNNLLGVLSRKRGDGFNSDEYLNGLITKHGASKLENLTTDQAKEVIEAIGTEMRK